MDTITITHGADTILLVKQSSGEWTVNRYPASQSGVRDFFEALRDSVNPELVAESPSSFARMGVDSLSGRSVRLVGAGKPLARLFVGGSYLRLGGDVRVYRWPGRLAALVARPADDWRDRQIGAVVPESVTVVEIERAGKRATLRKRGAAWVLSKGAPADSAVVARLLEHLRTVSAAGFASERQADSLRIARPRRRLWVRGASDRILLALMFDSTPSGFWVRKPEGGTVYRLDFWKVDELTPAESALKSHS